ncbi:lipopolysaccharide biosynthesis protein [Stutzerimonas stutzeri]|uniref:lipopolysaccharide biosynthesis protein n=1 Tax=Stutzerimonas stutzeri TaxID=316 RepID=UPI00244BA86C|nr:MATE family efflux transporter [Stutzerimonas stutzeri]MDH0057956.1 MATE family efflux transporter [Stutzerimonas stutzeri]
MLASNHKRILHNTGMLYIRMLLAMVVGLYTTRVLLNVLGVDDFGIYFVIAGFVALLGFMQGAMTAATQRYFAFDLGQNNGNNLRGLFNNSLQVHALLTICIVLIAETAGYWFVTSRLTIPEGRLDAALLAYHLSVASFAVTVMTVPLIAMLMANERMGLFALISMADILLKLAAVLLLPYLAYDKLSMYAVLLLGVSLLTLSGYLLINRAIFPAVRLQWAYDKKSFRSMLGFTAWNTWGNLAAALAEHGNNVLLNIFFGPAVNAGRSIASQANGALNQFVTNVQAAINPQIVKLYASGERQQMHDLVQRASKYNFLLLLVLVMPVLFYAQELLEIWLVNPPEYAANFLQLTIIVSLIDSVSRPLMTSAQATGKISLYQSVVGGILLLNVPFSYISIQIWCQPTVVIWSGIVVALIALLARFFILERLTGLAVWDYIKSVIVRVALAALTAWALNEQLYIQEASGFFILLGLGVGFVSSIMAAFFVGLDAKERKYFYTFLAGIYRKLI